MSIGERILALWERHPIRFTVALSLIVRAAWLAFAVWGTQATLTPDYFPQHDAQGHGYAYTPVQAVDAWSRWDALHYIGIAQYGYSAEDARDAAFFPLFPLLIGAMYQVTGIARYVCALVIGNVCDIVGWVLFALLARRRLSLRPALAALIGFALFPTRNFDFSAYTEGLFLACSAGAFLAYERRRFGFCALAAALASATRPQGVLVGVALLSDALWARLYERRSDVYPRDMGLLLGSFAGIGAYIVWLSLRFGEPLRFLAAQGHWHRAFGNPLRVFLSGGDPHLYLALLLGLAVCVSMWRYGAPVRDRIFCTLAILLPMCSGSMMSMARFIGMIFPLFIFAAGCEPSRAKRWSYAVIAALYSFYMAYRVGQGDLVI